MKPADRAWIALGIGVVAYDIMAPAGQTLSEGIDAYLLKRRLCTEIALALVYLHCSNKIPDRCDPIHLLFGAIKRF